MSSAIHLRRTRIERVPTPSPLQVRLTDQEVQICDLLDGCRNYLQEEKGISTTCRIAGGWVRDKVSHRIILHLLSLILHAALGSR